jgi:hypothetical protein
MAVAAGSTRFLQGRGVPAPRRILDLKQIAARRAAKIAARLPLRDHSGASGAAQLMDSVVHSILSSLAAESVPEVN